jgi:dTDP-4-dehydrorhamnose 3,5-epimerase
MLATETCDEAEVRAIASTAIPGLLSIELPVFCDERGAFIEAFNAEEWRFRRDNGSLIEFVEDDFSVNRRNVVRGLHGDPVTWKLVSCINGACFTVVVDFRGGVSRLAWESFHLDARTPRQLLVPAGCATGFASLEDATVFAYKQSTRYRGAVAQFAMRWNDPALGIDWPVQHPVLSPRDATAPLLVT